MRRPSLSAMGCRRWAVDDGLSAMGCRRWATDVSPISATSCHQTIACPKWRVPPTRSLVQGIHGLMQRVADRLWFLVAVLTSDSTSGWRCLGIGGDLLRHRREPAFSGQLRPTGRSAPKTKSSDKNLRTAISPPKSLLDPVTVRPKQQKVAILPLAKNVV